MSRRVALVFGAGVVAAFMFVGPGLASAATTIGQTGTPTATCTDNEAYVQKTVAAGPQYSPSASSVITAWSAQGTSAPNQPLTLLVLRQDDPTHYTVLGRNAQTLPNTNVVNTFNGVRLPIQPSQEIGVFLPSGSAATCEFSTSNGGDVANWSFPLGEIPDNTSYPFTGSDTDQRVNAKAVVEPDADHDGFGDETQDQCPSNAATQGACPVTTKKKKCKKHKKKHHSAGVAKKKKCKKKKHH
jgi:hypothetical protein